MDVKEINSLLLSQNVSSSELRSAFPNLLLLREQPFNFEREIGLEVLPEEPGLILIRGARQLGKSTWIESAVVNSYKQFGPASVFYLNCDYLDSETALESAIVDLLPLYNRALKNGAAPRLLIDEITTIKNWEKAIKRLYDSGKTRHLLIITTGSQAQDLRRGKERLPGRKGRLQRTEYYFPPLSFKEFCRKAKNHFRDQALSAYVITGGSPLACNELAAHQQVPDYVYALTREWLLGECARADRSRNTLIWLVQALWRLGPNPISVNQLAKASGAANNSVIQGYIDLLMDCLALATAVPWNLTALKPIPRKAAKYPWINLLAAWSFSERRAVNIAQLHQLPQNMKGALWEWLVAQEIWRRRALAANPVPELLGFSEGEYGAIDLISNDPDLLVEVKAGTATPQEFVWFSQNYAKKKLLVVSQSRFSLQAVQGITFEDFLLKEP